MGRQEIMPYERRVATSEFVWSMISHGYRVLINQRWPRGVSKAKTRLGAWEKDIAPPSELREWDNHNPTTWPDLQRRSMRELQAPATKTVLDDLVQLAQWVT